MIALFNGDPELLGDTCLTFVALPVIGYGVILLVRWINSQADRRE